LAIVVPILSIVIIALVVILILKHRRKSSPISKEEIEKKCLENSFSLLLIIIKNIKFNLAGKKTK
jgi:hypothetical protein